MWYTTHHYGPRNSYTYKRIDVLIDLTVEEYELLEKRTLNAKWQNVSSYQVRKDTYEGNSYVDVSLYVLDGKNHMRSPIELYKCDLIYNMVIDETRYIPFARELPWDHKYDDLFIVPMDYLTPAKVQFPVSEVRCHVKDSKKPASW